jgi:1-deoxy-D-xylulose-5-phosphate synthase
LPESRTPIQWGKSETLRIGGDITIAAIGSMVSVALEAATLLAEQGIEATVLNARFVKPLDTEALLLAAEITGKIVTVEENARAGGFGEAVRNAVQEVRQDVPVKVLALPDRFIEHGTQAQLKEEAGLTSQAVVQAVLEMVRGKGHSLDSGNSRASRQPRVI